MKKITKEKLLFCSILLLAIVIRLIKWPYMIPNYHIDEAMTAVNAKTIADYGTDMYGTSYPVLFETWKWGGQTALLIYLMAGCIKLFGFTMVTVRLPMLLISIVSVVIMYLLTHAICKNKKIALLAMLMTAISPWHILQSIYSLDCNLFPHIILIAIYLLYIGIDKKKKLCLYSSMIFFAISMYSYGLALYFVPFLLIVFAFYLLHKQKVKQKEILISMGIYLLIAMPIFLEYFVNFLGLETIQIGKLTIPYLSQFERMSDVLFFSNNLLLQLWKNISNTFILFVLQQDAYVWDAIPFFGTTYVISFFFVIYWFIRKKRVQGMDQIGKNLIYAWFLIALGIGIFIQNVTIYRLNVLWYPYLILISLGIYTFCEDMKKRIKLILPIVLTSYLIFVVAFLSIFSQFYREEISQNIFFDRGLVEAVKYVESKESDQVLIIDYNTYRALERPKIFVRLATGYNIEAYLDKPIEEYDIQYTSKYKIISLYEIGKYDLKEYPICIVPNVEVLKEEFFGEGYHFTSFQHFMVCEKE